MATVTAAVAILRKKAACDATVDAMDAGVGAAGYLEVYEGALLVVTFLMLKPAWGAATAADPSVSTANGLPISAIAAAATVGAGCNSYVAYDTDGTQVWSGTVSVTGGAGELQVDNVIVALGQTITITGLTFTQP
jgi:hypothetical protein